MKQSHWILLGAVALAFVFSRRRAQPLLGNFDLSRDEDLSFAAMDLISLEDHLVGSYQRTNNPQYLQDLQSTRDMRRDVMKRLGCDGPGESWCASKHLLGAARRLMETGNKYQQQGDMKNAQQCFKEAKRCQQMFWKQKKATDIPCPCQEA